MTYRASIEASFDGLQLVSDWAEDAPNGVLPVIGWNVKVPLDPTMNLLGARVNADPEWSQEEDSATFRPIGRKFPVVVSMALGGADGSMAISTRSSSDWPAVEALRNYAGTLLLESPYGWSRYIRIDSRSWTETGDPSAPRRRVEVAFLEVDRPDVSRDRRLPRRHRGERPARRRSRHRHARRQRARGSAHHQWERRLRRHPRRRPAVRVADRLAAPRRLRLGHGRRRRNRRFPRPHAPGRRRARAARSVRSVIDADVEEAEDGTLTVSGSDRSRRISRARLAIPMSVPQGTVIGGAIADVLLSAWPDCPIGATIGTVDKALGGRITFLDGADSDAWANARRLDDRRRALTSTWMATASLRCARPRTRSLTPVCATYYAGDSGVITGPHPPRHADAALQRRRRVG